MKNFRKSIGRLLRTQRSGTENADTGSPSAPDPSSPPSQGSRQTSSSVRQNLVPDRLDLTQPPELAAFQKLPDNVLHEISSCLLVKDQANMASTCRSLRNVVSAKLRKEQPSLFDVPNPTTFKYEIEYVEFLPDGETLLITAKSFQRDIANGYYSFWHFHLSQKEIVRTLDVGHRPSAFSEDRSLIVTINTINKREFTVYNLRSLEIERTGICTHRIHAIKIANNGTVLASISIPLSEIPVAEHAGLPEDDLKSQSTRRCVVMGPSDSMGVRLAMPTEAYDNEIVFSTLKITPNGKYIIGEIRYKILGHREGQIVHLLPQQRVWVWNGETGAYSHTITTSTMENIVVSPDNRTVFIDGSLFNIRTGKFMFSFYRPAHGFPRELEGTGTVFLTYGKAPHYVYQISAYFSPDGARLCMEMNDSGFAMEHGGERLPMERYLLMCVISEKKLWALGSDIEPGTTPYSLASNFQLIGDPNRHNSVFIVKNKNEIVREMFTKLELKGATVGKNYGVTWEPDPSRRWYVFKAWPLPTTIRLPIPKPPKTPTESPAPTKSPQGETRSNGGRRLRKSQMSVSMA